MLSDFLYAFNAVTPIFVVTIVGYILKNKGFLTDGFVSVADKLVFKVMLPCLLFTKVAYIDIETMSSDDMMLVLYCVIVPLVLVPALCITVPLFIKDKAKTGAFIQGVFRSNVAFLGIPFATNLFGQKGASLAAMVLAAIVPVYNVLAVVVLCIFNPDKASDTKTVGKRIKEIVLGIVKNPLIIGIVLAIPFAVLGIGNQLPSFFTKSVGYFADASTTLALITIGASFKISDLKGRVGLASTVSFIKCLVLPIVTLVIAYFCFGFRNEYLGIVMIAFGTPTAISSYIMAKNMKSDAALANQIVLMTTLSCMFTIFLFSFAMRRMGII